jgi:hypothetical protein
MGLNLFVFSSNFFVKIDRVRRFTHSEYFTKLKGYYRGVPKAANAGSIVS